MSRIWWLQKHICTPPSSLSLIQLFSGSSHRQKQHLFKLGHLVVMGVRASAASLPIEHASYTGKYLQHTISLRRVTLKEGSGPMAQYLYYYVLSDCIDEPCDVRRTSWRSTRSWRRSWRAATTTRPSAPRLRSSGTSLPLLKASKGIQKELYKIR